jgi:DNA-binding PadR family transcriptional regulator
MPPQEPLAPRDLHILSVLAQGATHGYGLIKAVEEQTESRVLLDPANLYRVLRRMRREGWIRLVGAADDAEGRRRTYAITPRGLSILRTEVSRLERLLGQLRPVLLHGGGRSR